MKPESLTMVNDTVGIGELGDVWFKTTDETGVDTWTPGASGAKTARDMQLKEERALDKKLREFFDGGLEKENDKIQLRVVDGRIMWIKSDLMEQKWRELTPALADEIARGLAGSAEMKIPVETEVLPTAEVVEEVSYEIGWYQDAKGDLYQFSGSEWIGKVPSKKEIDSLEFLG